MARRHSPVSSQWLATATYSCFDVEVQASPNLQHGNEHRSSHSGSCNQTSLLSTNVRQATASGFILAVLPAGCFKREAYYRSINNLYHQDHRGKSSNGLHDIPQRLYPNGGTFAAGSSTCSARGLSSCSKLALPYIC